MHINSISFNHHKIFGNIKINFFEDSEELNEKSPSNHLTDIFVEIDVSQRENYYTFIIGDNGIGKSVLMRNIVHFVNWNNTMDEPKLDRFINFYPENSKYLRYKTADMAESELLSVGIYNKYFHLPGVDESDFLNHYNAQLVFINGAYEKGIIHKNPRFRSFNYTSEINETKILFLNSLIRFKGDPKLKALDRLLGDKEIEWKLACGLSIAARTVKNKEDNLHQFILSDTNGVNIFNFLDVIKKIEISSDDKLITSNLVAREQNIFNVLYNSGAFFKLYFNSEMSFKALFEKIRGNAIISKIEEFLYRDIASLNAEKTLHVMINDDQRDLWDFLVTEANQLSEFDVYLLGLLLSLNLVAINITGNGTSIDTMSSGQKNLIRLFSYFADMPVPDQMNNSIVFFDEPENSLHPKWQQEFPFNFKSIVEDVYGFTGSHFIFATHSPVLLMKSALLRNSNVLRFYKNSNGQFSSEVIKNISAYSIEEVLLDEFKISYRDQSTEDAMRRILDTEFDKRKKQNDPIDSIKNSFDLRDKINDLFNELNQE